MLGMGSNEGRPFRMCPPRDDSVEAGRQATDGQAGVWEHAMELARHVVSDTNDAAWSALWNALLPRFQAWVRRPDFLGPVSEREDWRNDVVTTAWERLQHANYKKLRSFFESRDRCDADAAVFRAWLFRVLKNIGVDYLRSLPEHLRRRTRRSERPSAAQSERSSEHWQAIVTLDSDALQAVDPVTCEVLAEKMLRHLDDCIPERQRRALDLAEIGADPQTIARVLGIDDPAGVQTFLIRARDRSCYRLALELWSRGYDDGDIAAQCNLRDRHHASQIVHAAKEVLRRAFRAER